MSAKTRLWVILIGLMALAVVARLLPGPRTIDDAFITFRYSRNLLDGLGFVYNPGVLTLGTSTPLFTLLMALIGGLTGLRDFPQFALLVSAAADAGTVALLFLLARRLIDNDWIAALPSVLWALSPVSVTFAVGGMETSVTIFWMMAATALFVLPRRRSGWAEAGVGLCAGLGFLTRADALLWIAPLLLGQLVTAWRDGRRLPWRAWVAALLVMAPWAVFSTATFGSPIPNSVNAKANVYLLPPMGALTTMIQAYSNVLNTFDLFGSIGLMLAGLVMVLTWVFALPAAWRCSPRLLPLFVYPAIYFVVFAASNRLIFRWYMAPTQPVLLLVVFAGGWAALAPLTRSRRGRAGRTAALGAFGVVCVASMLAGWTLHPDHGSSRPAPVMAWHKIELLYQQMADFLVNEKGVTAQTRVASGDIGAIGFYTGATIVDTIGLVTPEMRRYYPLDPAWVVNGQNYAIPPALIADTMPDFLVVMEGHVRQTLERDPPFQRDYELILEFPTDYYGTGMRLYQRRASAALPPMPGG
ncbi:MAG: glycosyltransferase family 39 protein [Anaerolineae bacterium]|nr:glycosyltransferase family 39 protein [Anaerolineae bacterium]